MCFSEHVQIYMPIWSYKNVSFESGPPYYLQWHIFMPIVIYACMLFTGASL